MGFLIGAPPRCAVPCPPPTKNSVVCKKIFFPPLTNPHLCVILSTSNDRGALHEEYRTSKGRRGRGGKAWVPKRMPWRAFRLARRRISVRLSQQCGELSRTDLPAKGKSSVDTRSVGSLPGGFFCGYGACLNEKIYMTYHCDLAKGFWRTDPGVVFGASPQRKDSEHE